MEKSRCELCGEAAATLYCESDAAILCLRCDEKVHGANFIVAKHERSLLCIVCQSVTAWKASGPRLGRTVSVCDACVCERNNEAVDVESRDRSDGDDEPNGSSDEDDEDGEEIEEDGDNQVVPWSSSEEVSSSSICGRELKRRRDVADLDSDVEIENGGGSSSRDCDRSRSTATRLIGLNYTLYNSCCNTWSD